MDMYGVANTEGGQAYYDSIISMYADWGIDFIKVDDMSTRTFRGEMIYHTEECEMIRRAIDKTGRPIVLSSSPMTPKGYGEFCVKNLNMWRISDDLWDNWPQLLKAFDLLAEWNPYMGDGHFPDADMIPIGHLCVRSNTPNNPPRYTRLTRDEQYFLMSLWAIVRSPLILGCELTDLDNFSLSLITNTEMINLNQHSKNNRMIYKGERYGVWAADGADGTVWLGFFNFTDGPCAAAILLSEVGLRGSYKVIDIWSGKSYGVCDTLVAVPLNAHQGTLVKLIKV